MSSVSAKFEKAKPGDLFMETVACVKAGAVNAMPKVLVFKAIISDLDGTGCSVDKVIFTDYVNGAEVIIDADDRYGYYPPLTAAKLKAMRDRMMQLLSELSSITHVLQVLGK